MLMANNCADSIGRGVVQGAQVIHNSSELRAQVEVDSQGQTDSGKGCECKIWSQTRSR